MSDIDSSVRAVAGLRDAFAAIVGPGNVIADAAGMHPYVVEPRDLWHGTAACVVRPGSTAEVAAIMRVAAAARTPVVPQGGLTGLVGGSTPDGSGSAVVLSLRRLGRVRSIDPDGNTIVAEAGCTLADVRNAAADVDRLFPLSLGSEGSCTIGGNLGTNAGGTGVLAYGNMRDLALGLEVVLADGRVWNGLRLLRKDNTGYDLKHLFIGSEGTLGIITAAALKLFPRPRELRTALLAVESPAAALAVFKHVRDRLGPALTACELMPRFGIDLALGHLPDVRDPFRIAHPWYVLLEYGAAGSGEDDVLLESAIADRMEAGEVADAVVARSEAERAALWKLRHGIPEAQPREGGSIKNDVSVPVASVPAFIAEATEAVHRREPGARIVAFGHVGDGNIHFNISQPAGADKAAFLGRWDEIAGAVNAVVHRFDGSIAAEHGIGRLKRDLLPGVKDPVGLALMRQMKATLDPLGILNPGVVL